MSIRNFIVGSVLIVLMFSSIAYAYYNNEYTQNVGPDLVVKRTTEIMSRVHRGIMAIKDLYDPIKDYDDDNFTEGEILTEDEHCTGDCPPFEAASILFGRLSRERKESDVYIDISFSA